MEKKCLLHELNDGERFTRNGKVYERGMRLTVRGQGVQYLCKEVGQTKVPAKPFHANLEIERV